MKKYLPVGFLILNLTVVNVLVGFLAYHYFFRPPEEPKPVPTPQIICDCPKEKSLVSTPTPTATPGQKGAPSTAKPKTKSVSYVPVPGSGSTLLNSWTDVAGSDFYFDPAEHPGLTDVRFEVNMKLTNGNGQAAIRLYDVTHSIGVNNSEVYTASQTSVLVTSGAINFWSGRNQYRVQVKSLTADTAVFDSGRLRLVSEN